RQHCPPVTSKEPTPSGCSLSEIIQSASPNTRNRVSAFFLFCAYGQVAARRSRGRTSKRRASKMRLDRSFSQHRRFVRVMFGLLAAVLLLGVTAVFVKRSVGQEPVMTSYLLNLDMGQEWHTTLHLSNLEDQQISAFLTPHDSYGMLLGHGSAQQRL